METLSSECAVCKPGDARIDTQRYIATAGAEIVDEGGPLVPFLEALQNTFSSLMGEDIAIWQVWPDEEGVAPRIVCVIKPGVNGDLVTWL